MLEIFCNNVEITVRAKYPPNNSQNFFFWQNPPNDIMFNEKVAFIEQLPVQFQKQHFPNIDILHIFKIGRKCDQKRHTIKKKSTYGFTLF